MTADINQIDERLRQISAEVARLQKEADELMIAKRVFEKYSIKSLDRNGTRDNISGEGRPRPNGTPTTFEMVEFVLADAEKAGNDGLAPNELVQAIAARYWPGLVGSQILPHVYRLAKEGRFLKSGGLGGKFKRVSKKQPAKLVA